MPDDLTPLPDLHSLPDTVHEDIILRVVFRTVRERPVQRSLMLESIKSRFRGEQFGFCPNGRYESLAVSVTPTQETL